ncbi:EndoU domain-containing protein, partial [Clostridium butyricum]|uniref:EndoU domain-containing protein n=1 Tax=Clostridium butyricum TaxID=1492 RepID=UPI00374EC256
KKGESSFISLENDFYNNAGIVMENGSDKASNGAFDDDPQKGAAEAKAALEIMMNESALIAANEGADATLGILASDSSLVPMNNSSIPLEGKELEERSDIPDFDRFQEYDENQYVKKQMDDGTYVLGTAYRLDNKNVSIFTACDKEAVSEHTSLISELKSCGYGLLGAANRFIESMSEDQKKRDFESQVIINKNASKYGIDCPSEYMGFETKGKTVDELMHEWKENNAEWRNKNLRNNAPCKYLYDGSEIAGDIVIPFLPIGKGPLMWCGTKKVSVAKSGIKVASELKNGKALTESEIIASSGIGNLKGTKTSYVKSIKDLKNTDNFRDGALEHILEGEINKRGKAVGFHYEGFPTTKGSVIEGTKSTPDNLGLYTGKVEVGGVPKTSNGGQSTFFPENWTAQDVVDAINEAFTNKEFVQGTRNTYRGKTVSGLKIEMYIDDVTNKIISAFPKQ